ncbi:MAG: (deoxy)nucleoside triphosphate pyrophosphohydrolase [Bacteroidota bacterium]|nr:(deoxy)nucleoside triphosphate pyrophosphohydrolase [Bacteroidota bacterium]
MIKVTCAIIRNDEDEILVVRRGQKTDHPFKWEFPGGKLKDGETEEECILREIMEELSMSIVICRRMDNVEYEYPGKQIVLIPFICDTLDDLPVLNEHSAYKWTTPAGLMKIDFSEADIIVAENYLKITGFTENKTDTNSSTASRPFNEEELRSTIAGIRGSKEAEWLAESAIENQGILEKIIDFSFSEDERLAFHASWVLTKICDDYPGIIYPHLPRIIEVLDNTGNESARRSFLRCISLSDLNHLGSRHQGLLADHCFKMLRSGLSAIAIKAYSMDIIYKLAMIYPDLTNELTEAINMLHGDGSAGIQARGKIILGKLARHAKGHGSSRS